MEREWHYKISERHFWTLAKRVSRFYDSSIDVPGYVLTLLEENSQLDTANAFRILSNGLGNPKSHMSGARPDDFKHGKPGQGKWKTWIRR